MEMYGCLLWHRCSNARHVQAQTWGGVRSGGKQQYQADETEIQSKMTDKHLVNVADWWITGKTLLVRYSQDYTDVSNVNGHHHF